MPSSSQPQFLIWGRAAIRLDQQEAPQRELARQKKKNDENRLQLEMTWQANKAYFRP